MGGGTFAVFSPHFPYVAACVSNATHSPLYCEESPHDYHALRFTRSHHDSLLEVSGYQCPRIFLHWDCCVAKFLGRVWGQARQKRAAHFGG